MSTTRFTTIDGLITAQSSGGVRSALLTDIRESTLALLPPLQLTELKNYTPYGEGSNGGPELATPFRYGGGAGYYSDSPDRIYVRARTYQPSIGRWLTPDPLPTQPFYETRYSYSSSNPTTYIDPSGLRRRGRASGGGGPYHPPVGVSVRCNRGEDCETLKGKLWVLNRMISSHQGWDWNVPPPRGGGRHSVEIAELYRSLARCQQLLANCKPRPKPCQPAYALAPVPPPWDQNVPWEFIEGVGWVLIGVGVVVIGIETAPIWLPVAVGTAPWWLPQVPQLIRR